MTESENESVLEFPCTFPIKMMGRDQERFRETALELVGRHVDNIDQAPVTTAPSRNGNFLSITVTIEAQSQQQLDNIYHDLSSHTEILVAL